MAAKKRSWGRSPFFARMQKDPNGWKAKWATFPDKPKKFFRSRWELNFARFLQWKKEKGEIKEWMYEAQVFTFGDLKRGCTNYKPDFKVTLNNGMEGFYEVKGFMDGRSKTALKRMAKYHPDVKLVLVDGKWFSRNEKLLCKIIPEWELSNKKLPL